MKMRGYFWNDCTEEEKRSFYEGIIKEYNHDERRWLIQFDNNDDDQHMHYDAMMGLSSMRTRMLVPLVTLDYQPLQFHRPKNLQPIKM
mgnify:CR=1 FL=1